MRQMQSNGQNQSVRRLTSILLQDLEFDKISTNTSKSKRRKSNRNNLFIEIL